MFVEETNPSIQIKIPASSECGGMRATSTGVLHPFMSIVDSTEMGPVLMPRIEDFSKREYAAKNIYLRGRHILSICDALKYRYTRVGRFDILQGKHAEAMLERVVRPEDFSYAQKYSFVEKIAAQLLSALHQSLKTKYCSHYHYSSSNLDGWRMKDRQGVYDAIERFYSWFQVACCVDRYDIKIVDFPIVSESDMRIFLKIAMDAELAKIKATCIEAKENLDSFSRAVETASTSGESREHCHRYTFDLPGKHSICVWVDDVGRTAKTINTVKQKFNAVADPVIGAGVLAALPFMMLFGKKK